MWWLKTAEDELVAQIIANPKLKKVTGLLAVAVITASIGGHFLHSSHAATTGLSLEPETATVTGSASVQPDPQASGGNAVVFGTAPDGTAITYGSDGSGNSKTSDCTVTVPVGGNLQTTVNSAAAGAVICVKPADYSGTSLSLTKAVTVRANGIVKIKNATVSGGATLDGFTVVGGSTAATDTGINFSGTNNKIINNLIKGRGIYQGISCGNCGSGTLISGNTITEVNNYGIIVYGGDHITIEKNNIYDLYDTANNGKDVDGMRIFGSYQDVRYNYTHDLNKGLSVSQPHLDCMQNYQDIGSGGVIADHITIENNYCLRVSGMFLITKNNQHPTYDLHDYVIRGNVAETYGWQNIILSGIDGATIESNMIIGAVQGAGNITVEANSVSGLASKNIRIRNNIFIRGKINNPPIGDINGNPPPAGMVTDDTSNASWVDSGLITAYNGFVSSTAHDDAPINPNDFTSYKTRAQSNGSIIDKGSPILTTGLTTDVSGAPRIRGAAIDIGAYEIQ